MDLNEFRITGVQDIKNAMDKYSSSNADFFSLKDDGESAKVRFCHTNDQDLDTFVVHKVLLEGKEKYVLCLGPKNMPCPLCENGFRPQMRLFLTLEDLRDGKRKIWDRGKGEIPNILGFIARYGNLNSVYYEIVRHGKRGDTNTTYQFFPIPEPNMPEQAKRDSLIDIGFLLLKTENELKELITAGKISPPVNRFGPGSGNRSPNRNYTPQQGGNPPRMF